MKRVFIFIGLKILEIGGVLVALLIGSKIWFLIVEPGGNRYVDYFLGGTMGLIVLFLCVLVPVLTCLGLYLLIKHNWQLAKRITDGK